VEGRVAFDDPADFDIDVDLSLLLGGQTPQLLSSTWYTLVRERQERPTALQQKIEAAFHNALLRAQWQARGHRLERRRAVRVPLLSRVHVSRGPRLVSTDISIAGLRCSGRPTSGMLDIEFKLPGLAFPVAARVEVANFEDREVIPLVGLRFVDIERPYVEHIVRYVDTRRRSLLAA
jgi:hypothetical protein